MEITFRRLSATTDLNYQAAQKLYDQAFPAPERRTQAKHRATMDDDAFFAHTIYIGEQFAGILYFWQWDGYAYLEHLATLPELRGQNIGGRALEKWKE
ncbi:MAG: GNAT family N-acetyltransferase, partial [Mucinivorans sp.]